MACVDVSSASRTSVLPVGIESTAILSEAELLAIIDTVPERRADILVPVRQPLVACDVRDPTSLVVGTALKVLPLARKRVLLAVRSVQRIDVREELLGIRLLNFPRRVPDDRVETRLGVREHVREFQLPVKESVLILKRGDHSPRA